jgi:2-hydroxycyclohexanecarboxyl-CoA dehydrogenase
MARRVAIVSGGAGGIGAAVCRALAEDGREVAVADLQADAAAEVAEAISAAGGRAAGVELDVTEPESVERAVAEVAERLGPPHVLVNAAGWDELRPFLETDEPLWDRLIEINFKGCLRLTKAVLPAMAEAGFGRVVSVGSDAGRVGSSLEAVYASAKAGVAAFMKTVAREFARRGVTANTVCPGPTDTPLLERIVGGGEEGAKVIDAMVRSVPMKRLGTPEDVAPAVAFLASDRAAFITGQTLSVSGGLTMA